MTKETARDYLPLVQALAEGKTIQMRGDNDQEWEDSAKPDWTLHAHLYRIKPEPRRWWIVEQGRYATAYAYPDECDHIMRGTPFIEVVEVIK